jgi:hypothetical protein
MDLTKLTTEQLKVIGFDIVTQMEIMNNDLNRIKQILQYRINNTPPEIESNTEE